jgi:hypothetical protein
MMQADRLHGIMMQRRSNGSNGNGKMNGNGNGKGKLTLKNTIVDKTLYKLNK